MSLIENDEHPQPKENPIERPDHTPFIVGSLRALMDGKADARQQRAAIDYIVGPVCGTYDMAYRPKRESDTTFALGKQHVGQTIVWLLNDAPSRVDMNQKSARETGE